MGFSKYHTSTTWHLLLKGIRYSAAQGFGKPSWKVPGNVCLKQHLRGKWWAVLPEENQDYAIGWNNQSCTVAKHALCSNEGPVSQPASQIYTSWQSGPHLKEKNSFGFLNYLSHETRIKHKNAIHFAVFILLVLYIHLKTKTDLSVCAPGQFPFLDLHCWGGNSCTAGETFKAHTESCYHWNVWQKINLWTITAPVQLCENVCSPPLSLLLLSKCQFQTQCSFKNVITRFQTLLNDFSTVISRGINPFKFMSPKWNVTSNLHEHVHKLYRGCRIISLVPDVRKFMHCFLLSLNAGFNQFANLTISRDILNKYLACPFSDICLTYCLEISIDIRRAVRYLSLDLLDAVLIFKVCTDAMKPQVNLGIFHLALPIQILSHQSLNKTISINI